MKPSFVVSLFFLFFSYSIPQTIPNWKPYFTLAPNEGRTFAADSTAVVLNAGVPGLNIANDGRVILGWSGSTPGRKAGVSTDTGRTFTQITGIQTPMQPDGSFIYLPDGRTRYVAEEPLPGHPPQPHKSRIISWMSSDGIDWSRESGVRYQPGAADDSIASVPEVIQLRDSLWRMYYVGDWYRTNGIRTALTTDWGWTWSPESGASILRSGDVDPHPMYLTDGRVRLYHRRSTPPAGIAFTDGDGLTFDTTTTTTVVADGAAYTDLKLDPVVIRYPNGRVACYIGAAPYLGRSGIPKIIAAWSEGPTNVGEEKLVSEIGLRGVEVLQVFPNPFNPSAMILVTTRAAAWTSLEVYDLLGRKTAVLIDEFLRPGVHERIFEASRHASGTYVLRMRSGGEVSQKTVLLLR